MTSWRLFSLITFVFFVPFGCGPTPATTDSATAENFAESIDPAADALAKLRSAAERGKSRATELGEIDSDTLTDVSVDAVATSSLMYPQGGVSYHHGQMRTAVMTGCVSTSTTEMENGPQLGQKEGAIVPFGKRWMRRSQWQLHPTQG